MGLTRKLLQIATLPKEPPGWCVWCGKPVDVDSRGGFRGGVSLNAVYFCDEHCRISYFHDLEEANEWPPKRDPIERYKTC